MLTVLLHDRKQKRWLHQALQGMAGGKQLHLADVAAACAGQTHLACSCCRTLSAVSVGSSAPQLPSRFLSYPASFHTTHFQWLSTQAAVAYLGLVPAASIC
jgi:hypothetical protein